MACNCKHMEQEITEYKAQIDTLRNLFIHRMTVDSETSDRRRREYNQAIFHYRSPEEVEAWNQFVDDRPDLKLAKRSTDETYKVWNNIDMDMVLECFDNAVKDWRRTFCSDETCRRK